MLSVFSLSLFSPVKQDNISTIINFFNIIYESSHKGNNLSSCQAISRGANCDTSSKGVDSRKASIAWGTQQKYAHWYYCK